MLAVISLPAFPLTTYLLETYSPVNMLHSVPTVSVNLPLDAPHHYVWAQAPGPSILPMVFDSSALESRSARGMAGDNWRRQPQDRASSVKFCRCWQTQAVSGHADTGHDGYKDLDDACCVSFDFDITCEVSSNTQMPSVCCHGSCEVTLQGGSLRRTIPITTM